MGGEVKLLTGQPRRYQPPLCGPCPEAPTDLEMRLDSLCYHLSNWRLAQLSAVVVFSLPRATHLCRLSAVVGSGVQAVCRRWFRGVRSRWSRVPTRSPTPPLPSCSPSPRAEASTEGRGGPTSWLGFQRNLKSSRGRTTQSHRQTPNKSMD